MASVPGLDVRALCRQLRVVLQLLYGHNSGGGGGSVGPLIGQRHFFLGGIWRLYKIDLFSISFKVFNRPGVAGAVLQTSLSFIH